MSRRGRHGRHQNPGATGRPRPGTQATERPASSGDARTPARPETAPPGPEAGVVADGEVVAGARRPQDAMEAPAIPAPVAAPPVHLDVAAAVEAGARSSAVEVEVEARAPAFAATFAPAQATVARPVPAQGPAPAAGPAPAQGSVPIQGPMLRTDLDGEDNRPTCTVAQLRRFIKSRPWIPMHELRRRFGIYGGDDDVSPIRVGEHTLFIGLPHAEARLMAELLGGGDVGYELSLDPVTPVVVGVYPMRPVPRG